MRIELSILFCLMSIGASAQDVIIRKNGDEIQAKVLAVSDSEIDYKNGLIKMGRLIPCLRTMYS